MSNEQGLEKLEIYKEAMRIGEVVWDLVGGWSLFAKRTVGEQWVRSTDSIAANIAEGYGRYHYKENLKFCYYARGSLQEAQTWLHKATRRKLMDSASGGDLDAALSVLVRRLNAYIKSISQAVK